MEVRAHRTMHSENTRMHNYRNRKTRGGATSTKQGGGTLYRDKVGSGGGERGRQCCQMPSIYVLIFNRFMVRGGVGSVARSLMFLFYLLFFIRALIEGTVTAKVLSSRNRREKEDRTEKRQPP
jgi:hypothetical protein